ncbi:MAG: hypothetical protein V4534_08490 [Myxococcota bacterium]
MTKYIALIFALIAINSAQAYNPFTALAQLATKQGASYYIGQKAGQAFGETLTKSIVSDLGIQIVNDAVINPVFNWEMPSLKPYELAGTAAQKTAEYYAVPAVTQGITYMLGISNPLAGIALGLASQFMVGNAFYYSMKAFSARFF